MTSSGAWPRDGGSHRDLDRRLAQGGARLALNLDIDDTALASHYAPRQPVERVLRYARHARSHGVRLLFNTARLRGDGRMRQARRQLEHAGFRVAGICGRRPGEGLTHSKVGCRKHFVARGYTLVANAGDRATDFKGRYFERAYRLPNYDDQLS